MHQNLVNGNAIEKKTEGKRTNKKKRKEKREKKNENYACMQFIVITISLSFVYLDEIHE